MQRSIKIDEKEYRLANNAYTPIAYKAEFGQDYFQELLSMFKNQQSLEGLAKGTKEAELDFVAGFDLTFFYRLFYIFAKSADPTIGTFDTVFRQMEVFPFEEVVPVLMEMLSEGMQSKKKWMKGNPQAMNALR